MRGVRVAEHAEDLAQRHGRAVDAARAEAADGELAVEVPDAEAVVADVELGVGGRFVAAERIEVREQVAADPVHVHELVDVDDLVVLRGRVGERAAVRAPPRRLVGHAEAPEHVVVEAVAAEEQVVDPAQELAALGAADDPVVVGVRERRDRADAELRERGRVGALELGRDADGTDPEDEALPGREPRDGVDRPDHAGVRDGAGGAGEVVDRDLVGADPADQLLVRAPERREVHRVGGLHVRDDQGARAVALLLVDREPEVHVLVADHRGLAVDDRIGRIDVGEVGEGAGRPRRR